MRDPQEPQARLVDLCERMQELRVLHRRVRGCYATGILTPRDEQALLRNICAEAHAIAAAICQIMRDLTRHAREHADR
jgi:hypothetical protein